MPPPQRLGYLSWLVLGAVVALVPPVVFALWFMSEADLDAALDGPGGRPPVPPPKRSPPAILDPALVALRGLAAELVREGGPIARPDETAAELAGWTVVPPEFAATVHRAVAPARAAGVDLYQSLGDWDAERTVLRGLAVRIARDPPAALAALAADATALATLAEPRDADGHRRLLAHAGLLTAALTLRLTDLGPAQAAPLARVVHGLRDHLWRTRAAADAADLAGFRDGLSSRAIVSMITSGGWADLGPNLSSAWVIRQGRAADLRAARDNWWVYAGAAMPADLLARVRSSMSLHDGTQPGQVPHDALVCTLMAIDLLGAELDAVAAGASAADAAPPEDAYAPGHLLRPIMRAVPGGSPRRIGWYSVGEDGEDEGGLNGLDLGFPGGAEELGAPRFGDALAADDAR